MLRNSDFFSRLLAGLALCLCSVHLLVVPASARESIAVPEAPFGLTWLASKQALVDVGIDLGKPFPTEFGDSYVVSRLPKEPADQHYAVLSFGYDDRLVRITAIGAGFDDDHDGSRVKARYAELKGLLKRKYGAGKSEHHTDKKFGGDRFGLGLRNKKNWMYTQFTPTDLRIELSAFVEGAKTRWRIIFEYVPGMERVERHRKRTEEEAL